MLAIFSIWPSYMTHFGTTLGTQPDRCTQRAGVMRASDRNYTSQTTENAQN